MLEKTLVFKDLNIFYNIYENMNKETIVFIHSFGSSLKIFNDLISNYKRDYQLILFDLPGHGKSTFSFTTTFKDVPEMIKSILNNHNIIKTHLIGLKEGALIAQAFSNIYQSETLSLVLMSTYSLYNKTYKIVNSERRPEVIKEFFTWLFSFKKYKGNLVNRSSKSIEGKEIFISSMAGFKRRSLFSKRGIKRFYKLPFKKYKVPVYLICGSEDSEVIKDASLSFEQKYENVILEGYLDAKEIVFLDNNRLFNERLLTFLRNYKR